MNAQHNKIVLRILYNKLKFSDSTERPRLVEIWSLLCARIAKNLTNNYAPTLINLCKGIIVVHFPFKKKRKRPISHKTQQAIMFAVLQLIKLSFISTY